MDKEMKSQWERYKMDKVIRQRKYDRKKISDDITVKLQKKIILDDDMLKMIWIIKKKNPGLRNEKQVVRKALDYYLSHGE